MKIFEMRHSVGVLLALLLLISGCLMSREMSHMRRDIEDQFPGIELEKEVELTVESGIFTSVGRLLGRIADDDDVNEAGRYIQELRRVKIGVYKIRRFPKDEPVNLLELSRFDQDNWELATQVRDRDEMIWVLYREWYGEVRDIFVLVLNDEELVLVRMEGALDHLLEKVIEDELFVANVFGQGSSRT